VGRALGRALPVSAWWPSTDAVLARARIHGCCHPTWEPRGACARGECVAMKRVGATRVMARGRDHRGLIRDRGGVVPGECGVAGARAGSQVSGRAGPEPGLGP